MVTYDAVKDFLEYVTYDDNGMLYGGLVEDAPPEAIKAYGSYVKMIKEAEKKGIML